MVEGSNTNTNTDITIKNPDVVTKYQTAADISNRALKFVIEACKVGASVYDICVSGDEFLTKAVSGVFNKKKVTKGIAFPTALSINNCACHFSPSSKPASSDDVQLAHGDLVKIELGCHIDGYPSMVATTILVLDPAAADVPDLEKKSNVLMAAKWGLEAALRTLKPGVEDGAVTAIVDQVAEAYGCKAVEGMLSHCFQQHQLDSSKSFILAPSESQKKGREKFTFEQGEVYGVDILVSSGEGKVKPGSNVKTTIYKKTNLSYDLKLKASRATLTEITSKAGTMAFNLRALESDEKKTRLGLAECINHQLVLPYDVLYEKEGEFIAQFMTTVLLMPSGSLQVTFPDPAKDGALWAGISKSATKTLTPELQALVDTPLREVKKKSK